MLGSVGDTGSRPQYTTAAGGGATTPVFAIESGGVWGQAVAITQLPSNASGSPSASNQLLPVACRSATSCVAVGSYANVACEVDPLAVTINPASGHEAAQTAEVVPPTLLANLSAGAPTARTPTLSSLTTWLRGTPRCYS